MVASSLSLNPLWHTQEQKPSKKLDSKIAHASTTIVDALPNPYQKAETRSNIQKAESPPII